MNYWLVKSEPEAYSWTQLVKDGKTAWTGVRNFAARLNLRAMKQGDLVVLPQRHGETDRRPGPRGPGSFIPTPRRRKAIGPVWTSHRANRAEKSRYDHWKPSRRTRPPEKEMKLLKQSRLSVSPLTAALSLRTSWNWRERSFEPRNGGGNDPGTRCRGEADLKGLLSQRDDVNVTPFKSAWRIPQSFQDG